MRRILLCKTDAIGDLILTLPVARSLKQAYPQVHLAMLVSEYTEPILRNEEYLDGILSIRGRSVTNFTEVKKLTERLIEHTFDIIIFIYPRFGLALSAALAGIHLRAGTSYRAYSFLFNHQVRLHRKKSGEHELELNYALVESLFPNLTRQMPRLSVTEQQAERARELVCRHGIGKDKPYVVIHPLSRGSAPNWRLANYLDLADRVADNGFTVVFTGSAAEREEIERALRTSAAKHPNLAGQTDLSTFAGLIKEATIVLTSSTGPIHIATALDTFAVGLYPPESELSQVRWGPRGGACRLFVPEADSVGSDYGNCMDAIKVDTVAAYLLSKLNDSARLPDKRHPV